MWSESVNTLAIDPGGHTGLALKLDGKVTTAVADRPSQVWEFITPELDEVIYERFASSVATSHFAIYTIELCGSIQGRVAALNEFMAQIRGKCYGDGNFGHVMTLIRHEPQNRIAFLAEAKEFVHAQRRAEGKPLDKTIVHEIDAYAHLLAREALGDNVRKRDYGKGISNA
jgi:hypothetical protein